MQSESVVDVRNDSTNKKTVTVLVPCFNEQESLPMLFDRMDALITQSKDLDYTLMFVDDGSRDNGSARKVAHFGSWPSMAR